MAIDYVQETSTVVERFARQGRLFVVSKRWTGLSTDDYADLIISNPSNSGRELYILTIETKAYGQAWVDMWEDSSGLGSGTALDVANKYIGSSETSVAQVEVDGTYTVGTKVHETVIPGGSGIFAIGGSSELGIGGIIGQGHNLHIRVTNKDSFESDVSIRIVWWEKG